MIRPYKDIPLIKLEKIHYVQVQIIKKRELNQDLSYKPLPGGLAAWKFLNPQNILKEMQKRSEGSGISETMAGMGIYVGFLVSLPLEKAKAIERETAREIQLRKELRRAHLDQGNLDKCIKGVVLDGNRDKVKGANTEAFR